MKKINNQAFTLVELLIVVAILAVLATVGFVSYSNYLTGVRDTNRVTQLVGIRNAIETFKTTKDTPLPEEKIDIEVNGELIAYQGIVGQNILNQIGLSDGGTDPKDETYFPYYLTKDRKYFQLMTFLEDEPDKEEELTFFPQTYASTDYSIRYPKVIGFPLGILTEKDTNTPLHEIESLTNSGYLDVATTSDEYTAYFEDKSFSSGTGVKLLISPRYKSCKEIYNNEERSRGMDGIYSVTPTDVGTIEVFCDMTTDGGGWTLIVTANSNSTIITMEDAHNFVPKNSDHMSLEMEGISQQILDNLTWSDMMIYTRGYKVKGTNINKLGQSVKYYTEQGNTTLSTQTTKGNLVSADELVLLESSENVSSLTVNSWLISMGINFYGNDSGEAAHLHFGPAWIPQGFGTHRGGVDYKMNNGYPSDEEGVYHPWDSASRDKQNWFIR